MKTYTIIKTRRGQDTEVTGTLDYLISYFGYTLKAGHSYNSKISTQPKSAKSLVSNLNKSVTELQRGSYDPNYYQLKEVA